MYYAAIHLENNPAPGSPVGYIISSHSNKQKAQSAACDALSAYDKLPTLPEDQKRVVVIAIVAKRFAGQHYIYRHDLERGDVLKISVVRHVPLEAV